MYVCVKQKSRISPRYPARRLGKVTRGTECKKTLRGLVSFSSWRFIGATRRDLGNAHVLKKYWDEPREELCEKPMRTRSFVLIFFYPIFLNFTIIMRTLLLCPLFQIIVHIFLHKSFLFLIFLLFSNRIKILYSFSNS